jgi:hypothetical protein
MRKSVVALAALFLMVAVAGCYTTPVIPPLGGIYSDYSAPLTTEFNGQEAIPPKEGKATSSSVLGLFAWGDCSVRTAAAAGGLYSVSYCDYSYHNVLGIYQEFTVIARGK